jgi:hypothetical protein
LIALGEALAENCHDIWAIERIKQGWTWGPMRDDTLKTHPNLVPYKQLLRDEQRFDLRTSMETIKTILAMKYMIVRPPPPPSAQKQLKTLKSMRSSSSTITNSHLNSHLNHSNGQPLRPSSSNVSTSSSASSTAHEVVAASTYG